MHGMKKKRVPRTKTNPIVEAMRGAMPIGGKDLKDLHAKELQALSALATGSATPQHMAALVEIFNIAESMAKAGIGIEVVPIAAEVQVLLCTIQAKGKETGVWSATAQEMWLLREAWEYHDLQRLSVPLGEYRRHLKRVADILRTGQSVRPQQLLEQVNELRATQGW